MSNKTLTKAIVVAAIHEKTNRTRAEVKRTFETLLRMVKHAINRDNYLLISGFGKFEAYSKQARKGRNPTTGDSLIVPSRRVLSFRVSRKLREQLNREP